MANSPSSGILRLMGASALVAFVWLVALPHLCARPEMRERIERERAAGIDPGAMFYTELPAMHRLRGRMNRLESERPGAWWSLQ